MTRRDWVVMGAKLACIGAAAVLWINFLPSPTRAFPSFNLDKYVNGLSECDSRVRKPPVKYGPVPRVAVVWTSSTEDFALATAAALCKKTPGENLPDEVVDLANYVSNRLWKPYEIELPPPPIYTMNDVKNMLK